MTDGDALLKAILAHPDDDTPRLIYADWLEERGDSARADLIRVQCELGFAAYCPCDPGGRMPNGAACGCRWCELRRRQTDLMAVGSRSWVPNGWLATASPECLEGATSVGICLFIRGFVDTVVCPADRWLADADAIIATQPVITRVTLTTVPEFFYRDVGGWVDQADGRGFWLGLVEARASCEARWPRITFALPPPLAGQTPWAITNAPPVAEPTIDELVALRHRIMGRALDLTVDRYFDPS